MKEEEKIAAKIVIAGGGTAGLWHLRPDPTKTLCITPTTSKGQVGGIMMEVPVQDIGAFVEAIGSQLKTEGHWKGSDYGRWIDDNTSASSFDNHLFRLFLYASEKDAFRILGAFPEKFITI